MLGDTRVTSHRREQIKQSVPLAALRASSGRTEFPWNPENNSLHGVLMGPGLGRQYEHTHTHIIFSFTFLRDDLHDKPNKSLDKKPKTHKNVILFYINFQSASAAAGRSCIKTLEQKAVKYGKNKCPLKKHPLFLSWHGGTHRCGRRLLLPQHL